MAGETTTFTPEVATVFTLADELAPDDLEGAIIFYDNIRLEAEATLRSLRMVS